LKDKVKELLGGMPPNKQKLKLDGFGFIQDKSSLAYYNAPDGVLIELGVKTRGKGGK